MNEMQQGILNIWIEFDRVCRKLNIKYIAMGGTLLGALRHKGFIPWDDDMDVGMVREEYERFLKEAPKEFDKRYFVQEHRTDPDYYYPFIKIRDSETTAIEWSTQRGKYNQGLWLDVFPFDALPDLEQTAKDDKMTRKYANRVAAYYNPPGKTFIVRLLKPIKHFLWFLRFPSMEKMYQNWEHMITKYNGKGYNEGMFVWFTNKVRYRYNFDIYDEIIDADFEGHKMPISKKSVEMMEKQFGNWQQLPPENQRYTHPLYKLDLNKSYKEYLK